MLSGEVIVVGSVISQLVVYTASVNTVQSSRTG